MKLYDWQREDVDDLATHDYTGLLAMAPGSGKTICAVSALKESGADTTLIIAPKATHTSAWIPTLNAIGLDGRVVGNGNKAQKAAMSDLAWGLPGVYLITPQLLARATTDTTMISGDMLIYDECHQGSTANTSTQRATGGYKKTDQPLNQRFDARLALSGTPMRQNFENIWGVSRFLWPEYYRRGEISYDNYFMWRKERMNSQTVYTSQRDQWGNPKKIEQFTTEKEPGRWVREAPAVYIHKRREWCCEYHPNGFLPTDKPQEIRRVVDLLPAQRKAIREIEDHMVTYLDDNPLVADLSITQRQRVRQICLGVPTVELGADGEASVYFTEDCKSPFMDEVLQIFSELPNDENVLLFMDSQKFARIVTDRLNKAGIPAFEYSGATSSTRDDAFRKFGDTYRAMVAVTAAAGTGLDGAQHVSRTEIWLEQPVSLTLKQQAEARLDRTGGMGQVQRYIILDSEGYAEGQLSNEVQKRLQLAQSLRKA